MNKSSIVKLVIWAVIPVLVVYDVFWFKTLYPWFAAVLATFSTGVGGIGFVMVLMTSKGDELKSFTDQFNTKMVAFSLSIITINLWLMDYTGATTQLWWYCVGSSMVLSNCILAVWKQSKPDEDEGV